MKKQFKIEFYGGPRDGEILTQSILPPLELFISNMDRGPLGPPVFEFDHYILIKVGKEYQYQYQGVSVQEL